WTAFTRLQARTCLPPQSGRHYSHPLPGMDSLHLHLTLLLSLTRLRCGAFHCHCGARLRKVSQTRHCLIA
ncbi:hypothetical protein QVD17_12632, partial [Tagetes erecta]